MKDQANIFDIAREAGVSIATVSRVISGGASVRPETREKVLRAAARHHFTPNKIAAGLSKREMRTLGLVLPMTENPFYFRLYLAVLRQAQELDFAILPYYFARGALLDRVFSDALIGKRLDGVIFSGDVTNESSFPSLADCIAKIQRYMPAAVINPEAGEPDCHIFRSDLEGAMRLSIRHLNRLGHTRIAMLGGAGAVRYLNTREFAYMDEMRRLGLESGLYPFIAGETSGDGERCVSDLFSLLKGRERPTALVIFNDQMALGAYKQLRRMGFALPEDMALVSCDNLFFAPYMEPALTTVDLCIEDTASRAVRLLANFTRSEPRSEVAKAVLMVRESCGAASGRNQDVLSKARKEAKKSEEEA